MLNSQDLSFDNLLGFMTPSDGAEHWKKPTHNMINVNVDAADFSSSNCFSFSYVARNQNGDLLEAKASQRGIVNPHVAEPIGIREAWRPVQAIRSAAAAEMFSYFGRIICECKQHLIDQGVSLCSVRRSANRVAHWLANSTSSIADHSWNMSNAHNDLITVSHNDLNA